MRNRMLFTRHLMSLLIVTAAGSWASAGIIEDFQADTPGSDPSSADVLVDGVGYDIAVVDGSTTPVDPFGPGGNQSMMVEDNNNPGAPKVVFDSNAPLTEGVFSTDLYFEDAGAWTSPYAELRIGARGANSSHNYWQGTIAMYLKFNGSTLQLTTLSGGSPVNATLDNPVLLNATNSLELSFDTDTDSFTGLLNGVALTSGGGANSTFSFTSDQIEITSLEFVGGWTSKTGMRFFVDDVNLTAIPEPSSLGLVCLGAFVMCTRKVKKNPRG